MPTNKNAIIRYQTLDRCFRNPGRKYFIDDLIEACNEALLDIEPTSTGVKRRQIFDDIKFMKDSNGYNAPLESYRDGKKTYYRYEDKNFSISNQPLNEQEAQQLKESLLTLSRFGGLPQFDWVDEIKARLEQSFHLKSNQKVLSFEENPFLTGREFIGILYNAISNEQTLTIDYQSFKSDKVERIDFHPYHLKQYSNRWFLFGFHSEYNSISNLALDRIKRISDSNREFIPNTTIDFDEYFEDVIGVSIPENTSAEKIRIEVRNGLIPYIKTKPLHGSQKVKEDGDNYTIIELEVIINYELTKELLSYGEQLKVLSPLSLVNTIEKRLSDSLKYYSKKS